MVSPNVFPQLTTKHSLVLSLGQSIVSLPKKSSAEPLDTLSSSEQNLLQAQELICQFFLEQLKQASCEAVLQEFKHLFIEPTKSANAAPHKALDVIVSSDSEQIFIYTLKRSIYILVNNWSAARQEPYIQQLVQLLSTSLNTQTTSSGTLKRLTLWRSNFLNSQDYQELKLFVSKYEKRYQEHWSQRYRSYLLVSQAVDASKPLEQKQAARTYSKQLKEQFKLELAMYTARYSSTDCQQNTSPNPTVLGDEVMYLIQEILKKRGRFSYVSLARIFLNQNQQIRYKDFKQNLLNYLLFSIDDLSLAETIKTQLAPQINSLYEPYHERVWDRSLLLRTCKQLIESLTTVDRKNPSRLFILLIAQDKIFTLALLLLKLVLLCPSTHTHLECCLAQLIEYYKSQSESECQWLIHFLEVIQVTLTLYTEDVRYNLVNMSEYQNEMGTNFDENIYRVFSQMKREANTYQSAA